MPHITVECSSNLRKVTDIRALLVHIHAAALATSVFPKGGTRTRLLEATEYVIADGHPENMFVHIDVRIGSGRDEETKRSAAEAIFKAALSQLAEASLKYPLAISLELVEIDDHLSFKHNTIHDHLQLRSAAHS